MKETDNEARIRNHTVYRMVPFSTTSSTPLPQFQGHVIFRVEYLKTVQTLRLPIRIGFYPTHVRVTKFLIVI